MVRGIIRRRGFLVIIGLLGLAFLSNPQHILAADATSVAMVANSASAVANSASPGSSSNSVESASTALPDLFTGAMSYQIPIEVPAGRNGMKPDIALQYRSSNGNGWVGVGWELELGSIQRSEKNGVNYSADSFQIKTSSSLSDIVNVGNNEYLNMVESQFSRIRKLMASDGLPYWEVTDKNGVRYFYGQIAGSRQDNPANTSQIFKWCLDRIEDTNGNYMTITYVKDQGQIYLDRIDYNGNQIKFYQEGRNDTANLFTSNFLVNTAKRLKTIDIFAAGNRVRTYSLSYDADPINAGNQYSASTGRSLLSKIHQYGKDVQIDSVTGAITNAATAQEIPSIDLKYGAGDTNSFNPPFSQAPSEMTAFWSGYNVADTQPFQFTGDFNGDGKTDFMYWGPNGWNVLLNNGLGFDPAMDWAPTNNSSYGNTYWAYYNVTDTQAFQFTGDFNGDGKTDFMYWGPNGWRVMLSNGHGYDPPTDWAPTNNPSYGNTYWAYYNVTDTQAFQFTGDFNGDGKTDFMYWGSNGWRVMLSNGHGFDPPTDWAPANNPSYGNTAWAYYNVTDSQPFQFMGDFNGDGMTDFIYMGSNGWRTLLSNGHGFNPPVDWAPVNNSSYGNTYWADYATKSNQRFHFTGNFNGDGKTGFMFWGPKGWTTLSANGSATDLLTSIANGNGGTTSISYKSSTNYSNFQLPFPLETVSSITTNDGNGNISTTNYTYSGGFYHIGEKDFRGFNYAKVSGPIGPNGEQKITETWFHQGNDTDVDVNNPNVSVGYMKGKPYRTRTTDASGRKYSETTISYTPDTNGAPYFNPPYQVDSYTYNNDASYTQSRTIYTYDEYGNIIREDQYGDINDPTDDRTIVRSFLPNNTTNWIVGLPTSEDVYQGIGTTTKVAGKYYYYDDFDTCSSVPTGNQTPIKGNLTRSFVWNNGGTDIRTRTAYDAYGNPICPKDYNGNVSTITYDSSYTFPTIVTNPLGQQTVNRYYGVDGVPVDMGLYGQIKSVTDPNNATTTMEYDVFGRKTKVTLPDGTWTTQQYYDAANTHFVFTSSSTNIYKVSYLDGLGRTIKERSGADDTYITRDTVYNATGTIYKTSLPYFDSSEAPRYITYSYDPLDRVTNQRNPDDTTTLICYNNGVSVKIDANGHRLREVRDVFGRLIKVQEYLGDFAGVCTTDEGTPYASTQYSYDVLGHLRYVTDAKGNQTEVRYDSLGHKNYMSDPDMGVWSYGYDVNGNLTAQTDAKGQTITFVYDALNRLTTKHYPTGPDIVLTYDLATSSNSKGRLSTMTDAGGQIVYNYDNMGRTISSTRTIDGVSYPLSFGYKQGRLDSITYPDNEKVTYGYDSVGNLTSTGGYATYNGYNALSQPGTIMFGNHVVTSYQYYPSNNRLLSIATVKGTTNLQNFNYHYDNVGNLKNINDGNNNPLQSFEYDELNRLHTAGSTTYGAFLYDYDQIGNILTKEDVVYTYGGPRPHAVTSLSNGKIYSYDANGNIVSDGQRTITYNYDNMPTTVGSVNFTYDGYGTRIKKYVTSPSIVYIDKYYECISGSCTKYIYSGAQRIASKTAGNVLYYHSDHLGSTSVVTDASGVKVEDVNYLPFGKVNLDSGSVSVSHKYTGQEQDSETGLSNYNARLYDSELGRFLSPDTIVSDPENPQNLNRYSYVYNNPLSYTDPTGHRGVWEQLWLEITGRDNRPESSDPWANYNTGGCKTCGGPPPNTGGGSNSGGGSKGGGSKGGTTSGNSGGSSSGNNSEGYNALTFGTASNYMYANYISSQYNGQSLVSSEAFISFGEMIGASQLNAALTGYDFRGNEFSGFGRLGQFGIALMNAPVSPKGIWTATESKSSSQNAFSHWKKHAGEFPEFSNAQQYVKGAKDFMSNSSNGTLTKVRSNGDVLKYHPESNTFGAMDVNGAPKTMFRPTDGFKYWTRQ